MNVFRNPQSYHSKEFPHLKLSDGKKREEVA